MAETDIEALRTALHAERTENNTLHADCWACEAERSKTISDLLEALRKAQAASAHSNAVLERAVPDQAVRLELWRAHWRDQIESRTAPAQPTPAGPTEGEH